MIGFDHGIKPRIMIMGDVEYPNLIHEGKPCAMAYGRLPHFGLLVEPMFASLIFENGDKGRECFQHFKNWTDISEDGDALSLSFIETNEGGYAVCVYPEFDSLVDRCIPKYLQTEVEPVIMALISFPLRVKKVSEHYLLLKEQTETQAFVFCGAPKAGRPFMDIAIQKRKVQFYKEDEIPEDIPERAYHTVKSAKQGQHKFRKKPPPESPETTNQRRRERLRRFLPISIERLRYLPSFQHSEEMLMSKGFADWQILQAACNTIVSFRICGKPYYEGLDQGSAQVDILEYLLNTFEEPKTPMPPESFFSLEKLKKQLIADMLELLEASGNRPKYKSERALLNSLRRKGFLGRDG